MKVWAISRQVLLWGLIAGCAGPRAVPAPHRVVLPFATGPGMLAALAEANRDLAEEHRWALTGAHLTAETTIERYTRADGLELCLFPDPTAGLTVLELWWKDGWCNGRDPAQLAGQLAVPEALVGAVDQLGARVSTEVGCDLSVRRWWLPSTPEALGQALDLEDRMGTQGTRPAPLSPGVALALRLAQRQHQALVSRTRTEPAGGPAFSGPALVFVSGPGQRDSALQAVGKWPPKAAAGPGPMLPIGNLERSIELNQTEGSLLRLAWRVEDRGLEDRLALEALSQVLSGDADSRLGKQLGPGLGGAVSSRAGRSAGAIEVEILLSLDPTTTATQATEIVLREIRAVGQGETTGLELERARRALIARRLSGLAGLETRGRWVAEALLGEGDLDLLALGLGLASELPELLLRQTVASALLSTRPSAVWAHPAKAPTEAHR